MKVAFATDDGTTISEHFGAARYFLVATVENGQVLEREMREKPSHTAGDETRTREDFGGERHGEHHGGMGTGMGSRRREMAAVIEDCTVVVARGMGRPIYETLMEQNIRPILTDTPTVDMALQAFIEGTLENLQERIH